MVVFIFIGGNGNNTFGMNAAQVALSLVLFVLPMLYNAIFGPGIRRSPFGIYDSRVYEDDDLSSFQPRLPSGRGLILLLVWRLLQLTFAAAFFASAVLHCWPELRQHRTVRTLLDRSGQLLGPLRHVVGRPLEWLFGQGIGGLWQQGFFWEWPPGMAAAQRQEGRPRERATSAEVEALTIEVFASEEELLRWSVSALKDELRRLQRHAELRMGFAGGSATRSLLRSGVALEKAELVKAVLSARGGESGQTCTVCLAAYESGNRLRVLPCGHRFHCSCVDQWLIKQSRTCPLCSKRV